MNSQKINLRAGIRSSRLSVVQSESAKLKIEQLFPFLDIELIKLSSPGDRDKKTPISSAPDDFFTRDLDEAVLDGKIDFAIHSAKDLPSEISPGLDYFYLPWKEDSGDVLVIRNGYDINSYSPRVGSSGRRRDEYAVKRWRNAKVLPIRGNIEERLSLLDAGEYDILIMAAAALVRLNLQSRIAEKISEEELKTPEGQGCLALTFKKENPLFFHLKKIFLRGVVFAGAGIGSSDYASIATIKALSSCDICLYDALLDPVLLKYLSKNAEAVYVGKRAGGDSTKQKSISEMIVLYARQGKKVLRLKGGDPGLFGRLTEEVTPLEELGIPFRVIPGITSVSVATTVTGLLLTKRDVSRGYSVRTLQKSGSSNAVNMTQEEETKLPAVFLMTTSKISDLKQHLLSSGKSEDEPVSVIFNAGKPEEEILCSSLREIELDLRNYNLEEPSIIITGSAAKRENLFRQNGALKGHKVLLTSSEAINYKAADRVSDYLGKPIVMPFIETVVNPEFYLHTDGIRNYEWLILTSPSSVKHFMQILNDINFDLRNIPKIFVYGEKSADELRSYNISADGIGAGNLEDSIIKTIPPEASIARLRSDVASDSLSVNLRNRGYSNIEDLVLYKTLEKKYDSLPPFDDVVFASSSAVESFVRQFGADILRDKRICVIGKPTLNALSRHIDVSKILKPSLESVTACIDTLALDSVEKDFRLHI